MDHFVNNRYSHGGNSDTAGNARRLFREKNREEFLKLFRPKNPSDAAKIRKWLKMTSVLLRVLNSKEKVRVLTFFAI